VAKWNPLALKILYVVMEVLLVVGSAASFVAWQCSVRQRAADGAGAGYRIRAGS